jgi:hypothetical protein
MLWFSVIHHLGKGRKGRHYLLVGKTFMYQSAFENKMCTKCLWHCVACSNAETKVPEFKSYFIVRTAADWSTASSYSSYTSISNLCFEANLVLKILTDLQSNNWTLISLIEMGKCNKNKDLNFIEWFSASFWHFKLKIREGSIRLVAVDMNRKTTMAEAFCKR